MQQSLTFKFSSKTNYSFTRERFVSNLILIEQKETNKKLRRSNKSKHTTYQMKNKKQQKPQPNKPKTKNQ